MAWVHKKPNYKKAKSSLPYGGFVDPPPGGFQTDENGYVTNSDAGTYYSNLSEYEAAKGGYKQPYYMPNNFTPGQIGQFGFYPSYLGNQFPKPKKIKAPTSNIGGIEGAQYNFVDPMEFASKYSDFNLDQMKKNFGAAQDFALQALDTELKGMQQFTPAASALKRNELALDNQFNQSQRTSQFDMALPGAREQLMGQSERAQAFAEGRVPDSIQDRAFELGIRSNAADNASAGGFGASSSVARKASDLMSARERVGLSQYGDSLISNNINQRANLLMAPTQYSNAGAQINVNPSLSGSQLATSFASDINQNTLINPTNALTATIQQEQFGTNIDQQTQMFNKTNEIQQREFNIGNKMTARQFNANNINQFALSKFAYDVGYAGTVAGAAQTNANTELAIAQQAQYGQIFQGAFGQAQQAQESGSIAQGIATALPMAVQAIQGIAGLFSGDSGAQGGNLPSSDGSGGGVPAGAAVQSVPTAGGSYPSGESFGAPPGSIVMPSGTAPPPGYSGAGGMSVDGPGGGGAVYIPDSYVQSQGAAFAQDTGLNLRSTITNDPQQGVTKALLQANSVMHSTGFSDTNGPGMQQVSYTRQGAPRYAASSLLNSTDSGMGSSLAGTVKDMLSPLGVFSQKEDATAFDKLGAVAGDASFIAQLSALQQSGDTKGFMNVLLNKFQQPTIEALSKDPQDQAGLGAAFSAYNLYQNWGEMSPAQKGLGVATMGMQGYKFSTGESLANKYLVTPSKGSPGLTVSQGMGLFQTGVNTYSLVKNWDQMNNIQKLAAGTGNVGQIASLAKQFGMLGAGTEGAAVGGVTQASLQASGWAASPNFGIGAITSQTGSALPAGYQAVSTAADGATVAVPTANAASAQGALGAGSLFNTAAGVAGIAAGAYSIYKGWGTGGSKGAKQGALGGSAMAGGLYTLGATNPYLLGGVIVASALTGLIKTGKHGDQVKRDSVRGAFQKTGVIDKDFNVTLADGTKAYLGDDGESGRRKVTNEGALTGPTNNKGNELNSYDIDYTNDLDFVAGMGGMSLSRLMSGGIHQSWDQMGGQLGNATLKNVGYGKEMTQANFSKLAENQRSVYAQAGIKSKADAYQLANQMYAEGRINESDVVSMHQSFNMIYDSNGFNTAQKLMSGRQHGVNTFMKNPPKPSKTTMNPISADSPLMTMDIRGRPATQDWGAAIKGIVQDGLGNTSSKADEVLKGSWNPSAMKSSGNLSKEEMQLLNSQRYNVGAAA